MAGFILGTKKDQTQMFDEKGNRIPVTTIVTSPCYIVDIKNTDTDGYMSIKLGYGQAKRNGKSVAGQLKKAGIETPLRFMKEMRMRVLPANVEFVTEEQKKGIKVGENTLFIGDEVKPMMLFQIGDIIDVTGTSKGKGFQGVVRRHGFRGGPRTHGQSDRERAPGSLGSGTTPGRVFKGLKMAGRMGGDTITVQNLMVIAADETTLTVKGLVPGHKGSMVEVTTHGL
ncbi:MAG: 50S ribosomal protein L3 [Weeksellaceae bacterium]